MDYNLEQCEQCLLAQLRFFILPLHGDVERCQLQHRHCGFLDLMIHPPLNQSPRELHVAFHPLYTMSLLTISVMQSILHTTSLLGLARARLEFCWLRDLLNPYSSMLLNNIEAFFLFHQEGD